MQVRNESSVSSHRINMNKNTHLFKNKINPVQLNISKSVNTVLNLKEVLCNTEENESTSLNVLSTGK